jgi:hypothetical protein
MKFSLFTKVVVSGILLYMPALARDVMHNEEVHFDKGTTGTTIKGKIKGYETYNYKLGAKKGQYMRVSLETKHTATYFNIYEPGKGPGDAAMFIGTTQGNMYTGNLPTNGTYTIQVFMMRSAARRNEVSHYQLHVGID